jgi:hypothetical protein
MVLMYNLHSKILKCYTPNDLDRVHRPIIMIFKNNLPIKSSFHIGRQMRDYLKEYDDWKARQCNYSWGYGGIYHKHMEQPRVFDLSTLGILSGAIMGGFALMQQSGILDDKGLVVRDILPDKIEAEHPRHHEVRTTHLPHFAQMQKDFNEVKGWRRGRKLNISR